VLFLWKLYKSHHHHQDAIPDKYIVRTLLLKCGDKMKARGEIFAEDRLPWVRSSRKGWSTVRSDAFDGGV